MGRWNMMILLTCIGVIALADAAIRDDILALTGNKRTKIVWSRQTDGVNGAYGIGHTFRLMRFDTDVGTEADVRGNTGSYFRAKLSWDGNTIYYNVGSDLYKVGFDGTNNTLVATAVVLGCLWYDSTTGKEYAFAATGSGALSSDNTDADLYKIDLANPATRTLVFSNAFAPIWLSVSRDGRKLGGNFPWDGAGSGSGLLDVATGSLVHISQYG
jgi:hypothetical protein